jgi:hypothetical protein
MRQKGKKIAAITSVKDLKTLRAIEDQIDLDDAKKALTDSNKNETICWETIKRKLDL